MLSRTSIHRHYAQSAGKPPFGTCGKPPVALARAVESYALRFDRTGLPPRSSLIRPVEIRVSNNHVWRWRPPTGLVICRVGVAYKHDVVTSDERAVKCRANTRIGFRTGNEKSPDPQFQQHGREIGVFEGVAIGLLHQWFGIAGRQLWDDPPLITPPWQMFIEVLNPDDRNSVQPRLLNQEDNVRHNQGSRVSRRDDTILHVDNEERGRWPIFKRSHKSVPNSKDLANVGSAECH